MNRTVFHEPVTTIIRFYGARHLLRMQMASAVKYGLMMGIACAVLVVGAGRATQRAINATFLMEALVFVLCAFCLGYGVRWLIVFCGRNLEIAEERCLYLKDVTRVLEIIEYPSIVDLFITEMSASLIMITITVKDRDEPIRFATASSRETRDSLRALEKELREVSQDVRN